MSSGEGKVKPIKSTLASSLYFPQRSSQDERDPSPETRPKVATGISTLDAALDGGLEYGSVHCVTSDPDRGADEIVQALLISHLKSDPRAIATIIDSTISFDVQKLYQDVRQSISDAGDASQAAIEALRRLDIMRVFDFTGLTEATAELSEALETDHIVRLAQPAMPRGTVPDSDDEEEDMLDTAPPVEAAEDKHVGQAERPLQFLVINNISQLVTPLLKNNYVHGQALLTDFMRSLTQLTRNRHLCTLLISHSAHTKATEEEAALGLFDSCRIRPALGAGFGHLLDVHILLHCLPKRKHFSGTERQKMLVEAVNVLEMVQDREGGREGQWALFEIGADGLPKPAE